MNHDYRTIRWAYAGLVTVLLLLVAGAIVSAFITKDAWRRVEATVDRSEFFHSARFALTAEESLERQYLIEPSPVVRAEHAQAARGLIAALGLAEQTSGPSITAVVDGALARHSAYLVATHRLFAAVDAHNRSLALRIDHTDADPLFTAVEKSVLDESLRSTAATDRATLRLSLISDAMLVLTLIVSFLGIIALAMIALVLARYQAQVTRAMADEIKRLRTATLTDYLTGLGNHRAYQDSLREHSAERYLDGATFSIALIDVDELKVLNDRQGHVTGDRLLSSLAKVLRSSDLRCVPYRLGGDEFALTFSGMTPETARARMEHVRAHVEAELGGTTISIGVATATGSDPDPLTLREQADAALYEAKRRGRNNVVSFDDIRAESAMFLPARVAEVRGIIDSGTMGVAFQPIWDVDGRKVFGYEALARPVGDDPINPQDAFDIAEKIGRAQDLDRVCRSAILRKAGATLPSGSKLFVNVSPQSLDHDAFIGDTLLREVAAAGLTPDRVVLEITERSLARLYVVVREAKRLRELGFALALDDAGSGNSGLEMLSQLAVDYVKIDREVLVRAQHGGGGRAVLAGIVAIAHEMGARIIAEGVEDAEMLALVMHATRLSPIPTAVQGYFLGRPSSTFLDAASLAVVSDRLAAADTDGHDAWTMMEAGIA